MGESNAGIILAIFAFYICIIVLFGLVGRSELTANKDFSDNDSGILGDIAFFFQGIGFTLSSIPLWGNTLIFLPLGITIGYIIVDTVLP